MEMKILEFLSPQKENVFERSDSFIFAVVYDIFFLAAKCWKQYLSLMSYGLNKQNVCKQLKFMKQKENFYFTPRVKANSNNFQF